MTLDDPFATGPLPPGMAAEITQRDHGMAAVAIPIRDLAAEFAADPGSIGLAAITIRPGVYRFATRLEHEHYPPHSGGVWSTRYRIYTLNWARLSWQFLRVPGDDLAILQRVAAETAMRIAVATPVAGIVPETGFAGVIIALPHGDLPPPGFAWFPVGRGTARVYTLENASGAVMPLSAAENEAMMQAEKAEVDAYLAAKLAEQK